MDNINKKTLGIDQNGGAVMVRPQVLLLILCILLICMKHIVLMLDKYFDNLDYDDDTDADTNNDTGDDTDVDINTHIMV